MKKLAIPALVLFLALGVRGLYLWESSAAPLFDTPVVDSMQYDGAARSLSEGDGLTVQIFWQSIFYPLFLAAVYACSGGSIVIAKAVQIVLGSVTCLLTYELARRLFDRTLALFAAAALALYGPLVFYEAELLATGWATFWSLALVLLAMKAGADRQPGSSLLLGLGGGLAVITRPTYVPLFPALLAWLAVRAWTTNRRWRPAAGGLLLALAGFAVVGLPVAWLNRETTGRFAFLPASGGINLYIGNNPDIRETMQIRPGYQWERLSETPSRHGARTSAERQRYFLRQVYEFALSNPLLFVKNQADKSAQFVCSRELPRSLSVYSFRPWSRVLRALVWKAGAFGFPFGLLFPLALIGFFSCWRALPPPVWLLLGLYPLSVILVFVAARHRMPVIPVLCILAAAGGRELVRAIGRGRLGRAASILAVVIVTAFLTSLGGPYPQEEWNYTAQLYHQWADARYRQGRLEDAVSLERRSIDLQPDHPEAHNRLGVLIARMGNPAEGEAQIREALDLDSDYGDAHVNLANVLAMQGRLDEALLHYREALRIRFEDPEVHLSMGLVLLKKGERDAARRALESALRIAEAQRRVDLAEEARRRLRGLEGPSPAGAPE